MNAGYLCIASATFLFSTMEIALKTISGQFNPVQINLLRFFIGALLLLPFALGALKKKGTRLGVGDWAFFALTGLIGITVSMTLYQLAIPLASASLVAIVFSCNPVFIVPFAYFILKERVYASTVASAALCIAGMFCILGKPAPGAGSAGVLLTVAAGAAFALYGVVGKTRAARYGGIANTCFSFLAAAAELALLALASRIPAVAGALRGAGLGAFADIPFVSGITLANLPVLAYVSLCVTGLGYASYFLAIEKTSASMAALVFYIKPALAPLLAFFMLGETLRPAAVFGMVLIVCGSAAAFIGNELRRRRAPAR